ncbi:sulfotransferase domain-containing protein [Alteromonas oceanisediminis]|uniref:sulfotransferase domain-containing protein n=1 Tax=Alteromonas oceanisediminis TaxID=2836180 RepID=UPI001BDA318F|nr:sulfotransferase domain-containing protein [Alteromonas oceanisediminis]MBT0585037.1 sulfotransferase domain-containing protein [Alteromonas oceanisediminis]
MLLHHCEVHSQGKVVRFRDTTDFSRDSRYQATSSISRKLNAQIGSTLDPTRLGIFVREPAARLAHAYIVLKKLGHTQKTFRQYYSEPQQLNVFNEMLQGRNLKDLSFVGVFELFNTSLLRAGKWFNVDLTVQQYYDITADADEIANLLTAEHKLAIQDLHAIDCALYAEAKVRLNRYFESTLRVKPLSVSRQKKVIIHIGPPKTGTSAIQKWLRENQTQLSDAGIFYPPHTVDANGVSSGNFLSLLSQKTRQTQYFFDVQKSQKLLSDFETMPHHTLLLSSERFYNHLLDLFLWLPQAKYVFYIRHPLDLIESSYHQEVKRHQRVAPFNLADNTRFSRLCAFLMVCSEMSIEPMLRFYDCELQRGSSLIADFTDVLGIRSITPINNQKINSRFGFGELELMRFCNQFFDPKQMKRLDSWLLRSLDFWLQRESQNQAPFSFISRAQAEASKRSMLDQLSGITQVYPELLQKGNVVKKLTLLASAEWHLPFKDQSESWEEVLIAWQKLKKEKIHIAAVIAKRSRNFAKQAILTDGACVRILPWSLADTLRLILFNGYRWCRFNSSSDNT